MANGSIDQLNFEIILNDTKFNERVKQDLALAKEFNTTVSQAMQISAKLASSPRKLSIDTKKTENSLKQLNDWYRELEKADWTRIGKDLNVAPYVQQAINKLKELEKELNTIQALRQMEGGGPSAGLYAAEYKKAMEAATGLKNSITALQQAQKALNAEASNNAFRAHIEGMTRTNFELKQMSAYYKELEQSSKNAKSTQAGVLTEAEKAARAEAEKARIAKEYEAVQKRIAENLAKEAALGDKTAENERFKAQKMKEHADNTAKMNAWMKQVEESSRKNADNTKRAADNTGAMNSKLISAQSIWRTISQLTGVYFGAMGIRRFVSSLVQITGQFEVQRMALRAMLKDIDGADQIFQELYRFSSDSTYRFSELAKYAKQLAAFNIGQDSLLETTKMLGDVASGVGASMDRIILAYGHVKTSGFLRGIQLRSFSQNGIPILEELAKILSEVNGKAVSLGEVFDRMTKREITFEMVEEAFKRMTSAGGTFYQMQETLAKTLSGQINILKGRWENLMAAVGDSQSGFLKGAVGNISEVISSYDKFAKTIKNLILIYGAYKTAMITAMVITRDWAALSELSFVKLTKSAMAWVAANPYALVGASVAALTAMIVQAATKTEEWEKVSNVADDTIADFASSLASEIAELDRLYTRLNLVTEGTEEYDKAKRAMESRFGPYIQELRNEGVEVSNLAALYDGLKTKIESATRARALEAGSESLKSQFENSSKALEKEVEKTIATIGKKLEAGEQEVLASYVYGIIDESNPALDNLRNLLKLGDGEGGPQSFNAGTGKKITNLQTLRTQYERIVTAYNQGLDKIETRLKTLEKLTDAGEGGGEEVGTYKISDIVEGIRKYDADIKKLRDKAVSPSGITDEEKKTLENYIEARDEMAKEYKDLMGVDFDKETKTTGSDATKALNKQTKAIKDEISLLQRYKDAYDKLMSNDLVKREDVPSLMQRFFGETDLDYVSRIGEKLSELVALNPEMEEYAESVRQALAKDDVGEYLDQLKALDQYEKTMRQWANEDFNLTGRGVELDIQKVLKDYNEGLAKIEEKATEATKEAEAAHRGNAKAIGDEKKKIDELAKAERAALKVTTNDKLMDLAKTYVKDKTSGLKMSDWGDKSMRQVKAIWEALEGMMKTGVELTPELSASLAEAGLSVDEFAEAVKEGLGDAAREAEEEYLKKLTTAAKYCAQQISSLAGSFRELGEATDNDLLVNISEVAEGVSDMVSSIAAGAKAGGWIGALVAAAVEIGKSVAQSATNAAKLRNAIRETRESARAMGYDTMLGDGVTSIFGTDSMRKVANAIRTMDAARASMRKFHQEASDVDYVATPDKGDISRANAYFKAIEKGYSGIAAMSIRTHKSNWLLGSIGLDSDKYSSLADVVEQLGYSLYDQNGNYNAEALKAVLDTYDTLKGAERDWIQKAIDDSEAYTEALELIEGVMEDVFGDIASSAADNIIDSWIEAGRAALDYADILDDVAKKYAKMVIESTILDSVFNDEMVKAVGDAFRDGDYATAMSLVDGGMARLAEMEPVFEQILNTFDPYFKRDSESGSGSLGSGIKSITEDTAGLLASYINAIRADVSVMRGLQQTGWRDVSSILGALQSPTLNDHIARTAANTDNIAQSNSQILRELQSVIRSGSSGGMVVMAEVV